MKNVLQDDKSLLSILPLFILLLLLEPGCQSETEVEADARPNVILFFTDELQFSDLGCYGGAIPTPNLDRLAAEGGK